MRKWWPSSTRSPAGSSTAEPVAMAFPGGSGSGRDGDPARGSGIGGLEGLYRKVTQDRPDTARSFNVKSVLALENDRLHEAAELIGRAIAMEPDEPIYLIHMARVCARAGWWRETADNLRRAIYIDPRDAESWYGLGIAFDKLGALDQARLCWEQCVAIDPAHREARKALALDDPEPDMPPPPPPFIRR